MSGCRASSSFGERCGVCGEARSAAVFHIQICRQSQGVAAFVIRGRGEMGFSVAP